MWQVLLGVGTYLSYDLVRMRLARGSLSSITLPAGLVLTLHTRDELQVACHMSLDSAGHAPTSSLEWTGRGWTGLDSPCRDGLALG